MALISKQRLLDKRPPTLDIILQIGNILASALSVMIQICSKIIIFISIVIARHSTAVFDKILTNLNKKDSPPPCQKYHFDFLQSRGEPMFSQPSIDWPHHHLQCALSLVNHACGN